MTNREFYEAVINNEANSAEVIAKAKEEIAKLDNRNLNRKPTAKQKENKAMKEAILDYIFKWSLTHRINNKLVNLDTINHYVLTTDFNFFFECNNALKIEELFKMEVENIENIPDKSEKLGELRRNLWKKLN